MMTRRSIMMERTQSFFLKEPNSNDKIRIFCFPYAGGGASAYRNWGTYLPNYVGVYPIQIPGRENRITEKALTDMCKLTDKIVSAIHPYLDTPYLVFGHSLGAKISYEVCNELREKQDNAPCHLIVSGSRAPHIPEPEPLHHLQDVDFIEAMKRYSGMSKECLENRDLLNLFLPIFRADFILDETYCFTKYEKFDFPITALYGDQDQDSEIDTVEAWSEYTNTSFNKKVFHGEHFFIKTSEKEVLAYIKDIVSRYV